MTYQVVGRSVTTFHPRARAPNRPPLGKLGMTYPLGIDSTDEKHPFGWQDGWWGPDALANPSPPDNVPTAPRGTSQGES